MRSYENFECREGMHLVSLAFEHENEVHVSSAMLEAIEKTMTAKVQSFIP